MQYTNANVFHWFRDELADLIVAALKENGAMQKGALIIAVMEKRGLKPYEGNILMRAHLDEMIRSGILAHQRHPGKRPKTTILDLASAAKGEDSSRAASPEDVPAAPLVDNGRADAPVNKFFGELISGLVVRMNEIVENLATLNEASAVLMDESSVMREGIAMIAESMNAGFARVEQASADRQAEILHALSAIREAVVSGDAGADGYASVLVALEDLSRQINEPDDMVRRLGSSHAMLRDLLAERGSAANHSAAGASRG